MWGRPRAAKHAKHHGPVKQAATYYKVYTYTCFDEHHADSADVNGRAHASQPVIHVLD